MPREGFRNGYDPLVNMPDPLRKWAGGRGLARLVERYGCSFCEVCGRIGIPWFTDWLPEGSNLEFQSKHHGWLHPPANGWGGLGIVGQIGFRGLWTEFESEYERNGKEIDPNDPLMPELFHEFMTGVANSPLAPQECPLDSRELFEGLKGKGFTNPFDFCLSAFGPFGTRQGGKRGVCPKCGKPGTGEGRAGGERRFFHGPDRSCYLGMVEPKRRKGPKVKCSKCGGMGRKSIDKKGYQYIRHKSKTCYIGKVSDSSTYRRVETSETGSNETTHLETNSLENEPEGDVEMSDKL